MGEVATDVHEFFFSFVSSPFPFFRLVSTLCFSSRVTVHPTGACALQPRLREAAFAIVALFHLQGSPFHRGAPPTNQTCMMCVERTPPGGAMAHRRPGSPPPLEKLSRCIFLWGSGARHLPQIHGAAAGHRAQRVEEERGQEAMRGLVRWSTVQRPAPPLTSFRQQGEPSSVVIASPSGLSCGPQLSQRIGTKSSKLHPPVARSRPSSTHRIINCLPQGKARALPGGGHADMLSYAVPASSLPFWLFLFPFSFSHVSLWALFLAVLFAIVGPAWGEGGWEIRRRQSTKECSSAGIAVRWNCNVLTMRCTRQCAGKAVRRKGSALESSALGRQCTGKALR